MRKLLLLLLLLPASLLAQTQIGGGSSGSGTATSVANAPVPSSAFTVFPATSSACTTYSAAGTNYCVLNNSTGAVSTGTDIAALLNTAMGTVSTTGGHFYFKNGVYNINSVTTESNSGCTNSYGIGIPNNTLGNYVQFIFEGETRTSWVGELGATTIQTNGVIFNVTATAITAAGANFVTAIWQRPNTNGSGCQPDAGSLAFSNEIYFKNLACRFPTNQRGSEGCIVPWFALTVDYEDVLADFNIAYNTIATGSAPVVGASNSFGLSSTYSSAGNLNHFKDTYAVGYNIGYDIESEHTVMDTATAIYNNYPIEVGRQGTAIFHPIVITKFTDQENLNGILLGPKMNQGSRIDIIGLDMEFGSSNWYARTTGGLVETNCGYTSGIWTYQTVKQGSGVLAETPANQLFSSCGGLIQLVEGTFSPNFYNLPGYDSFTHPNAGNLGPAWVGLGSNGNCSTAEIVSNKATVASSFAGCIWAAQNVNNDQFSKVTVSAIDAAGGTVAVRGTSAANTYYDYVCETAGGRLLRKRIAGTFTTLSSTASNCANGDTIELDVVGTSLFAYYNGALDLTAVDASIASGLPGIVIGDTSVTMTNWSGGSMPFKDSTRSLYSQSAIHPQYFTLTNCAVNSVSPAACGSAAAGAFVIPTTTATYTVNTTAVTANSVIIITPRTYTGNLPSTPTCVVPTITAEPVVSAIVAGTSFTLTETSTIGQTCWNYWVVN